MYYKCLNVLWALCSGCRQSWIFLGWQMTLQCCPIMNWHYENRNATLHVRFRPNTRIYCFAESIFCVICANFILHPLVLANSSQPCLSNPTHCMLMNNIKIHQIRFFSNDIMLTIWNSQNAKENYCCLQETVGAGGEKANITFCCITWHHWFHFSFQVVTWNSTKIILTRKKSL